MRILKYFLFVILISALVLPNFIFGEEDLKEICEIEKIEKQCENIGATECRKLLEKCEKYYQEEIEKLGAAAIQKKQEKKTLQNQIYILRSKIEKLDLQIYQSNLIIKDLGMQIKDTKSSIEKTALEIENSKHKIAEILRAIYKEDQKSLVEVLLLEDRLSDFFSHLVALEALNLKNQELLENIESLKVFLEGQKQSLEEEQKDLEGVVKIQMVQKEESEKTKKEKDWLLRLTKAEYQKDLKEKEEIEERAKEIRKRLFELVQVPEAPTFEQALELAKEVEKIVGIRPAFLLAILTVESVIGKNVGQCNCPYCRYPDISWKEVMPKKQQSYFLEITQELGRDPDITPISCAVKGASPQSGGAMGPAQFMPETWLKSGYKKRVEEITGIYPADPWRIKDAFLAAGLYLTDWGAASQKPKDEKKAAIAYLCGSSSQRCVKYYGWYGDIVMEYARQYQKDIELIEKVD